jgi:chemotaxis protein histidine kinase CheA
MPKTAALAELIERINRANQALQKLKDIFDQKNYIKLSLAVHIMHTFQAIKELAQFCNFKLSTNFATTLEHIIDQILKGRIAYSPTLHQQLQHALACLAKGIEQNEKNIEGDYIKNKKELQKLLFAPSTQASKHPIPLATADLLALKLESSEQSQLSLHEQLKLATILNANKTLFSYIIHVRAVQLEQTVVSLVDVINTLGSLLTITPTMAQSARFDYAFVFIFTSDKTPEQLISLLPTTGILTAVNHQQQPQSWPIHGATDAPTQELVHQPIHKKTTQEKIETKRFLRFSVAQKPFAILFTHVVEVSPFEHNYLLQQDSVFLYVWHDHPVKALILKDILYIKTESYGSNVIIAKQQNQHIALVVDTILGQGESVVQTCTQTNATLYCAGQADFGDDKLVQILQIEKLFELVMQ